MTPSELERELAAGAWRPLYLFHGQEPLLREKMLEKVGALVVSGMEDFNRQTFLADESSPADVLDVASTMPFMQRPRVVILRGVDAYTADELSLFLKYLDSPNEDAILVLVADKVDWRLKLFKAIKDKDMVVSFDPPRGRGLVTWVQDAMGRRGPEMTRTAAEALIEQVGTDPAELDREVEKISLYVMGESKVDVDAVRAAARLGHTANVFKLGDAVGRQNVDEAMAAIDDLLATDHHLPVLIMLIRHFRILLKAKVFMAEDRPRNEAPKALGVPPFTVSNYMEQARELSLDEIKKGLARLQQANLTLVTTQTPERLVMDSLVLELSQLKMRRRTGP